MIEKRTLLNIGAFLALSALLVYVGVTTLLLPPGGGMALTVSFSDAAGLAPRNDVTMDGVPVGAVETVELMPSGEVEVSVRIRRGISVSRGTRAEISRRSPIGDLVLNLDPGTGPPMPDGGRIGVEDTVPPPDPERTIEVLAQVLHAVPSGDLAVVIEELATAVRGRSADLASLSETTADLPERLLQVRRDLEALIRTGPEVTGVLAANAETLADDVTQTAILADILRDNRFELVELSTNGANFAEVANELIAGEKANLSCLIADLATINAELAEPRHLAELEAALVLNHYFFNAVRVAVQRGKDDLDWFRVQLLPHNEPPGASYVPQRPAPDVFAANACRSPFGPGVGPGTQPGPVWLANGSELRPGR